MHQSLRLNIGSAITTTGNAHQSTIASAQEAAAWLQYYCYHVAEADTRLAVNMPRTPHGHGISAHPAAAWVNNMRTSRRSSFE